MRPTRILHTESSLGIGGQEFRIVLEAREMARRGHTVVLAANPHSKVRDYAERNGVRVEPIEMWKWRADPVGMSFPFIAWNILHLIRRYGIQIINTHSSVDSWCASLAGRLSTLRPTVIRTRHNSAPVSNDLRHRILYQKLPHAFITTSESIRDEMVRHTGIDARRVACIPTGVDLEHFRPRPGDKALKREFGFDPSAPVVGTVAFLRKEKGIQHFIEAASLVLETVPAARFMVVGEGPDGERLHRMISTRGLNRYIALTGFHADMRKFLATFDVFVLPSLGGEGTPQSVTQALAMERAVVATKVDGIPEVVEDGVTGFLVSPQDSRGLADRVRALLEEPSLREKLGKAGRVAVSEAYSLESMLDRTERLYRSLLDGRARPPGEQGGRTTASFMTCVLSAGRHT